MNPRRDRGASTQRGASRSPHATCRALGGGEAHPREQVQLLHDALPELTFLSNLDDLYTAQILSAGWVHASEGAWRFEYDALAEYPRIVLRDPEGTRERFTSGQPWPDYGRGENIAGAALFLASDDAVFVNGTGIAVDGGRLGN